MSNEIDITAIIDSYETATVKLDRAMVEKAIKTAIKYHGSQKRASGEPYYKHPLEVATIISRMKMK